MENDLEKYIFDPANPQKCKVYNLLLKNVKEKDNVAFISPYFFFHIFEKQFDFIKNELWDVPDNFDDLNTIRKALLYISQYSLSEFYDRIKNIEFHQNIIYRLFNRLFNRFSLKRRESKSDGDLGYSETNNKPDYFSKGKIEIEKNLNISKYVAYLENENIDFQHDLLSEGRKYTINPNVVFFMDNNNAFGLDLQCIFLRKASVAVIPISNYRDKIKIQMEAKKYLHPLLLKDIKDVHLLLDVLYRDMQKEESMSIQENIDIPYLKSISIKDYFCIEDIQLDDLQDKKEIYIVGENGDGKTLFLQALTLALKQNEDEGCVSDVIKSQKERMKLNASDSGNNQYSFNPKEIQKDGYINIAAYGVSRNLNGSDKDEKGYFTLFNPSHYLNNPVKWLQYLDYKQSKKEKDQISLEVAKKMLRDILDENVEIEVTPDKVTFTERGTEVEFHQLSDGYKTVITWVCDMIERFAKNQPYVSQLGDLKGIVLVDEIDLHLHPKWKYQIVRKLRRWFPNIQFIVTTHSDTVILGSTKDAVFYKVYKENGIVKISKPLNSIKNQMANTILTSPLFDLEQARAFNNDDNVDTSDDFLYSIIHREIAKRIKQHKGISEDQILDMVIEELDKFEAGHDKNQ